MNYSKTTDDYRRISTDCPDGIPQEMIWTGTVVPEGSSKTSTSTKDQKQTIREIESIAEVLEEVQRLYESSLNLEDAVNISSKRNYGDLKEDNLKEEIKLSDGFLFQISEYLSRVDLIVNKAIQYLEGL